MVLTHGKLGVIGAGVMGHALIQSLIETHVVEPKQVWAAARTESSCKKITEQLGIQALTQYQAIVPETETILLCVKPSSIQKVLQTLKGAKISPDTLIISIVAGTSLEDLQQGLGQNNPIIRAMPNTPCVVREGMTVICGGETATDAHLKKAHAIFSAVGQTLELEETHFDAVTGLGGSGPAYIYLMIEALADGGVRVGLPREVALKIVTQTVLGAATMVEKTGRHPAALRDDVTTPAGCTIAGLLIMEDGKIRSVLARAVEEAAHIAGQLGRPKQ